MNPVKAETLIKRILLQAGRFALKEQPSLQILEKPGQALTNIDLKVSKLVATELEPYLTLHGHFLVDEEFIKKTPKSVLAKYRYVWVLDPVDGTIGFLNQRRGWGIALALLDHGKPVAGGIYLPAMGDMLITERGQTRWTNYAWDINRIIRAEPQVPGQSFIVESFFGPNMAWGDDYDQRIWVNRPESAVLGIFHALTGKAGAAVLTKYRIWDIAAGMALAANTGHKVISMDGERREWEVLTAEDFSDDEHWKMRGAYYLGHPDNFDYVTATLMA